jgi:CRP-like cAMP-binding protein
MAAANADSLLKDAMGASGGSTGERKYRSRSRYGTEIEKLEAGDFFGHKALLQRDEGSLYSAFANEPLELLAVTVDDFTRILLRSFQEDFHTKAEFLSGIEFFSGWSPHLIRQLVFTLREKRYHPGECIFRQDIQTHCLYLVKSGSIKLSTHCNRKPPDELVEKIEPEKDFLAEILAEDQPKELPPAIDSLSKVSLISGFSRVSLVSGMSQVFLRRESVGAPLRRESMGAPLRRESVGNTLIRRESKANLMSLMSVSRRGSLAPAAMQNLIASEKKKNKQNSKPERKPSTSTKPVHLLGFKLHEPYPESTIEICNLGPGEFLAEIEAMCRLKHHLFNAVCMTTTVVYEVDLFYIGQLLQKKAPRTLYCLLQHIIQKVESWQERHRCVQFFEPLTIVLGQADRRMTAEGANKPIRRQHHYDASTLALMATRSLGKPILFAGDKARRKSVALVVNDSVKDISCTPFSSLYGSCANPLSPASCPINTFKRCLSSPANFAVNSRPAPDSCYDDSNSLPSNQANISSNPSKPPHRVRHRSAPPTSSRRIPKPTLKKKFSFDIPPPRQYRTRPNLMSSVKFPVPPPSPYPFQEDQNTIDSLKQSEEEQSEDDRIEIVCMDSSSPAHSGRERQRCRSANLRRPCTRSPLPVRPSTAVPFSNKSRPVIPISIDNFSPLSTPSRKVVDDACSIARTPSDVSLSEYVDNDDELLLSSTSPPSRVTTATPIVIPIATTSDADLRDQVCGDTVDEGLPNEESRIGESGTGDSLSEPEQDAMAAKETAQVTATDSDSVGPSGSAINGQYKQVRISDKLEFLGPKSLSIAPHTATILPMKEVENSQLQSPNGKNTINTHSLVQALAVAVNRDRDKSQLDDSEINSTTIPEEYARLQEAGRHTSRSPRTVLSPDNNSSRANEAAQDHDCEWDCTGGAMATYSGMQTGGERYLKEASASPTCKCVSMSFTAPMDYQTR